MLPDLIEARSVQVRLLVDAARVRTIARSPGSWPRWPVETDTLPLIAAAFAWSAQLLLAQQRFAEAKSLLVELDEFRGGRSDALYAALLPQLLRVALGLREPELANRLVRSVEAPNAAGRPWSLRRPRPRRRGFRGPSRCGHPLCRGGRRLARVRQRSRACVRPVRRGTLPGGTREAQSGQLDEARDLFASMGYRSAQGEIDALLDSAATASSAQPDTASASARLR